MEKYITLNTLLTVSKKGLLKQEDPEEKDGLLKYIHYIEKRIKHIKYSAAK